MRDGHGGGPHLDHDFADQGIDHAGHDRIEAGGRLVEKDDFRLGGNRAGESAALRAGGWLIEPYIPDRYREGYGLSKAGIDRAAELGAKVLVALDCGVKAFDEVDYAVSLGIDVIVADHHQPECRNGDLPRPSADRLWLVLPDHPAVAFAEALRRLRGGAAEIGILAACLTAPVIAGVSGGSSCACRPSARTSSSTAVMSG